MIPADLLAMLRCPQSGQPCELADPETLARINDRILQGRAGRAASDASGAALDEPLTEALVRLDRLVLYPIRDGIPVLLAEEAILL